MQASLALLLCEALLVFDFPAISAVEAEDVDEDELDDFRGIIPEEDEEECRQDKGCIRIEIDKDLSELHCPQKFAAENCRVPCECCDGPEDQDCVICSVGYTCIDKDHDGAGECVKGSHGSRTCASTRRGASLDDDEQEYEEGGEEEEQDGEHALDDDLEELGDQDEDAEDQDEEYEADDVNNVEDQDEDDETDFVVDEQECRWSRGEEGSCKSSRPDDENDECSCADQGDEVEEDAEDLLDFIVDDDDDDDDEG